MSIPLFFPPPIYRAITPSTGGVTVPIRALCELAGARCKASGDWTRRPVELVSGGANSAIRIEAAPGGWGLVRITLPFDRVNQQPAARLALAAMAFAVMDPVCRQSIANEVWARPSAPRGRPKSSAAMSNAERQRRFREKSRNA